MSSAATASYVLPSAQFRRRMLIVAGLAGFIATAGGILKFEPWLLFTEFKHFVRLAGEMVPPNFGLLFSKTALYATLADTLAMAFLGTVGGGSIAFVLSFFAARNTAPHPFVRSGVRLLFQIERATPNFILLLLLLIAVGFGPFAGFLALMIGSIGMTGKFFADAIEQVEVAPAEAVTSVGASRLQVIRFAILPQALPSIVASWFYAFDVNLRMAVALGIYGGGGLGFELNLAVKVLRYRDVLALVLLVIALILTMERVSDCVRRRFMGGEALT